MKLYFDSNAEDEPGRYRTACAIVGAALLAAVVPVLAVLALALSTVVRRELAAGFAPAGRGPDVSRRLAFGWIAGFALVMVGMAAGAAAGPMSMLNPLGLVAHTLFGLFGEVVMAVTTILVLRRYPQALSAQIDG